MYGLRKDRSLKNIITLRLTVVRIVVSSHRDKKKYNQGYVPSREFLKRRAQSFVGALCWKM